MPRRVFFSFHYDEDCWRVSPVRQSGVTKNVEANHPIDKVPWEAIKRQGDDAVKRWINVQLEGTSVTVVLIGAHTSERKFVQYEVLRSAELGKGLLGIRIHNIKNQFGQTSWAGANPLDNVTVTQPASPWSTWPTTKRLSDIYKTYEWVWNNGYQNFPAWVEEAALIAGRR